MMRHRRSLLTAPALIVAGALLGWIFAPPDAQAQERRIMISDDGSGPTFFHVSLPDLRALGRPDFERSDLPVFKERLRLDALQQIVLETLLSSYLEEFDEKIRQQLPRLPQRMSIPGGQMEEHAHGQGGSMDSLMGEAMAQAGHVHEDLDIEVDGSGSVAVFIGAQGMGEGPAELPEGVVEEGGDFDVVVQSQTPEGDTNAAVRRRSASRSSRPTSRPWRTPPRSSRRPRPGSGTSSWPRCRASSRAIRSTAGRGWSEPSSVTRRWIRVVSTASGPT
ncbi:MAG: hypothetical protein ACYS0D_15490 [Planctomycetota bacterium]|jgi:hypothetical protein